MRITNKTQTLDVKHVAHLESLGLPLFGHFSLLSHSMKKHKNKIIKLKEQEKVRTTEL